MDDSKDEDEDEGEDEDKDGGEGRLQSFYLVNTVGNQIERLDQHSLSFLFSFLLSSFFTPNVDDDVDEDVDKDKDEDGDEGRFQSFSLIATAGHQTERPDQNSHSLLFSFLLTSPFTRYVDADEGEDEDKDKDKNEGEDEDKDKDTSFSSPFSRCLSCLS